jgi:hypothetical protein
MTLKTAHSQERVAVRQRARLDSRMTRLSLPVPEGTGGRLLGELIAVPLTGPFF